MQRDRFVVTSGGNNAPRIATVYQVLDSAYCYETCFQTNHRTTAEECAGYMNMGDLEWPERRHHRQAVARKREAGFRAA